MFLLRKMWLGALKGMAGRGEAAGRAVLPGRVTAGGDVSSLLGSGTLEYCREVELGKLSLLRGVCHRARRKQQAY